MSKQYLLSCSCGESLVLEVAQAGQTVACRCGKTQQAPTLLNMKKLPTVEENTRNESASASSVNLQFFFQFLGVTVLVPSLIFLLWVTTQTYPKPVDVLQKQVLFSYGDNKSVAQNTTPIPAYEHDILNAHSENIAYLPPFQTYLYFRTLKNGPVLSYNFQENYQMIKDAYRIRLSAAVICTALGLFCLVASLFMPRQMKSVGARKGAEWN